MEAVQVYRAQYITGEPTLNDFSFQTIVHADRKFKIFSPHKLGENEKRTPKQGCLYRFPIQARSKDYNNIMTKPTAASVPYEQWLYQRINLHIKDRKQIGRLLTLWRNLRN